MTCFVAIQLANKFQINMHKTYFKVSQRAASQIGTSAELKFNDKVFYNSYNIQILVIDLLYCLMLPRGNDAAQVLADNLGYLVKFMK